MPMHAAARLQDFTQARENLANDHALISRAHLQRIAHCRDFMFVSRGGGFAFYRRMWQFCDQPVSKGMALTLGLHETHRQARLGSTLLMLELALCKSPRNVHPLAHQPSREVYNDGYNVSLCHHHLRHTAWAKVHAQS